MSAPQGDAQAKEQAVRSSQRALYMRTTAWPQYKPGERCQRDYWGDRGFFRGSGEAQLSHQAEARKCRIEPGIQDEQAGAKN